MSLDERFRHTVADALAGVQTRLQSEFETTLGELRVAVARERDDVLAQAEAARTAAVAEARDTLQRELREAFDAEKASLAEAHAAELERTRAEAEQAASHLRAEAEQAQAQLRADADTTLTAVRDELREAQAAAMRQRDEFEQAAAQTTSAHQAEVARLGEALASASGERDELRAVLTRVQEEQATAVTQAEQTLAAVRAEAEATLVATRAEADATLLAVRSDAEAAQASLRARAEDAASTLTRTQELQQASGARLLESVRALDGAASLPEVLDALAHGAGKEAGRAAVLVVKGDRLIGWRSTGFGGIDEDPRSVQFSTGDAGALAAAVNTGRPAVIGHGAVLAAPAFSHMDATGTGLAVPLLVAGKPVAVVYAEAGGTDAAPGWTSPVELLARHAGRCIEALAVQRPSHTRASGVRLGVPA
jgi:hypothetical protein